MSMTVKKWTGFLDGDGGPSREAMLACLHSSRHVVLRLEVWRKWFGDFGGIGFKKGVEIELVPKGTGGPRAQVPDWALRQLELSKGETLCVTERAGQFFLKKLRLEQESSQVPGCTIIDTFGKHCVTRCCGVNGDLGQIRREGLKRLLRSMGRFRTDPVISLVKRNGAAGLVAKKEFLGGWRQKDRSLAREYRQEILQDQQANGSWEDSSAVTSLRLIRLLDLGADRRSPGVLKAANWLLGSTEPKGFPGMFMFDEKTARSFNKWKSGHRGSDRTAAHPTPRQVKAFVECADLLGVSNSFCELKLTWTSAAATEALLRLGFADHPRVIRAINSQLGLRRSGRWCGCGNFVASRRVREVDGPVDFDRLEVKFVRPKPHRANPIDWPTKEEDALAMDLTGRYESRSCGRGKAVVFRKAELGSGDCSFAVHRGLSWHRDYAGSSLETLAALEWECRQGWDGSWTGNNISFVFNGLARLSCGLAGFVILRSVPMLIRTQCKDGLWSEGPEMAHQGWARRREPLPCSSPEHTTLAVCRALEQFGFLAELRPKTG